MEIIIKQQRAISFMQNQTLFNLQLMKNEGLELYELKNGRFEIMHRYKLPLNSERLLIIYDKVNSDKIQPIGVAVY